MSPLHLLHLLHLLHITTMMLIVMGPPLNIVSGQQLRQQDQQPALMILNYAKNKDNNNEQLSWFQAAGSLGIRPYITTTPTTTTTEVVRSTTMQENEEAATTEAATTEATSTTEERILTPPPTIISGEPAKEGEYPFMVAIAVPKPDDFMDVATEGELRDNPWICSGTLISDNYVLTAADCAPDDDSYEILVAVSHRKPDLRYDDYFKAKRFIIHPKFRPPIYNNIALIEIPTIKFSSKVFPACVRGRASGDNIVIAAGFVKPSVERHYRKSDINYIYSAKELTEAEPKWDYYNIVLIKSNFVLYPNSSCLGNQSSEEFDARFGCAGIPGGQRTPCDKSYPGGPVFVSTPKTECKFWVIGIATFGPMQCGGQDQPDNYTHLGPYLDWIEEVIRK